MLFRLLSMPLLLAATASACLNTPGTDLDGHDTTGTAIYEISSLPTRIQSAASDMPRDRRSKSPATPAKRLEAEALDLIYGGDYAAALPLLRQAEALSPGDYSIAANLGTDYELVGDNTEALRWITEAMRRNPASHHGTEWVHVLVLAAKLRDASPSTVPDPRPPLLEVPERVARDSMLQIGGRERSAEEVRDAIAYQLYERVLFVKPKDPYVADLLFVLARLNANLVNVESASRILALAETYGYADAARIAALRGDIRRAEWMSTFYTIACRAAGMGSMVGLLVVGYRRKWFFLTRKAYLAHRARLGR